MSKSALIVWGGWEGHEPEAGAAIIGSMLEDEGFAVRVETETSVLRDPIIQELDLIVPIYTMSEITKEEAKCLAAAVEGGVGLGGYHGGMCDAFRGNTDYQFICGGQWVAHPGDIIDYRVEITKPKDPIVAGIEAFDYHSEQYYMHVDPAIEVLATTTFTGEHAPWTKGVVMPVVWKHRYGNGRVFFSSLGHVASEFDVPQMKEILRRGLLWSAHAW